MPCFHFCLVIGCVYYIYTGDNTDFFTIKMHHGGEFSNKGDKILYSLNKNIDHFDFCELDRLSYIDLHNMHGWSIRLLWVYAVL